MQTPPIISFRNLPSSEAIEAHVRSKIEYLESHYPRIIGCEVVVEAPQKRKVTGQEFLVRLTLKVPGPDIHISKEYGRSDASEDMSLAVNDAFQAAERMLREQDRRMSNVEVKHHPEVLFGIIDRVFEGEGYGFARIENGEEFFFHRSSIETGKWEEFRPGRKIRFRAMDGEKGPYAASVSLAG